MGTAIYILQYHQKHENMDFKDGYYNTQKQTGSHSHRQKLENKFELFLNGLGSQVINASASW